MVQFSKNVLKKRTNKEKEIQIRKMKLPKNIEQCIVEQ